MNKNLDNIADQITPTAEATLRRARESSLLRQIAALEYMLENSRRETHAAGRLLALGVTLNILALVIIGALYLFF